MKTRPYNFSSGPAALPEAVLKQAQQDMLDWRGLGVSIMELSHRHPAFETLLKETEILLRDLMAIPPNYHVLFLSGGARSQFSMVPMNLLAEQSRANYLVTGVWSKIAYQEAQKYGRIILSADGEANGFLTIPDRAEWNLDPDARYCYYTPNETISGVEFKEIPAVDMPLVADMTSCILAQPFDVSRFGIIFAAAQKNMGQAGVTVVIIRDDLITKPLAMTPSMFDYRHHRDTGSLYNTAPTYAIYIMNLVLQHWVSMGGVAKIAEINRKKAAFLYQTIDKLSLYKNYVDPSYRSKANVTFHLNKPELTQTFIKEAADANLLFLKGHKSVGGLRASIYNAMPFEGVEALSQFMHEFAEKYQ